MIFNQNQRFERVGWLVGYILAYFLFTTVLFFMLTLLKKLPRSGSYLHVAGITLAIAILALIVKRLLK